MTVQQVDSIGPQRRRNSADRLKLKWSVHSSPMKQTVNTNVVTAAHSNRLRAANSSARQPRQLKRCTLTTGLVLASIMVAMIGILINFALAEHALSEVWNDSDGLSMKYSTDHGELLSTKGSEISLRQQGGKQDGGSEHGAANSGQQEEEETVTNNAPSSGESSEAGPESGSTSNTSEADSSASSGEEGGESSGPGSSGTNSESSGEHSSGSSAEDQSGDSGSNEQGTDSSSRQTDRVPPAKQYFSASNQHLTPLAGKGKQQEQQFADDGVPRYRSSIEEDGRASQHTRKRFKSMDSSLSFNSALQDTNEGQDFGSETANVDHDDDSSESPSGGGLSKFRQPGRLFKEAVRMNESSPRMASKTESSNTGDGDDSESNSETAHSSGPANLDSQRQQEESAEPPSSSSGEPEFPAPLLPAAANARVGGGGQPAQSFRARQTMIDFDRVVDTKQRGNQVQRTSESNNFDSSSGVMTNADEAGEGEVSAPFQGNGGRRASYQSPQQSWVNEEHSGEDFGNYRQPNSFHDQSGQRTMAAGSAPVQKERTAPSTKPQSASAAKLGAYKQLAYFKSINQQQQQQQPHLRQQVEGGDGHNLHQRARHHHSDPSGERPGSTRILAVESPDSVRDNFISPGHFPGSMPYLTQAASETQKKLVESLSVSTPLTSESSQILSKDSSLAIPLPEPKGEPIISASTTTVTKSAAVAQGSATLSQTTTTTAVATETAAAQSSQRQQMVTSDTTYRQPQKAPAAAATTTATTTVSPLNSLLLAGNPSKSNAGAASLQRQQQQPQPQLQHVTPEPETQPESQQIMAPILLSTTTMAPMPSTSTTSTTSQAPSLKRFKFRKYS